MNIFQYCLSLILYISLSLNVFAQSSGYVYNRDVEIAFAEGVNAYYEGDYETAIAELDRAMGAAQDAALAQPIKGVVEALGMIADQGVGRIVLSNAVVRDVRAFGDSPLATMVDDACMSCFTGLVKPDVAAYLGALDRAGTSAGRSLFVGDGGSDEFLGAREAGFARVVAVTGPVTRGAWRSTEEQRRIVADADMGIVDVPDLLELIEG